MTYIRRPFLSLWLATALVLVPLPSAAMPMEITVFEAFVYADTDVTSERVATLYEGQKLSASERVYGGWRKVRLEDGRMGWMQDAKLKVFREEVQTILRRPTEPTKPVQPVQPKAEIYVKDLSHLAKLVRSDAYVYAMAKDLDSRDTQADAWLYGGLAAGTLLAVLAIVTIPDAGDCDITCDYTGTYVLISAGAVLALGGSLVSGVLEPDREDVLDVVNAWNGRHPESPFTVGK